MNYLLVEKELFSFLFALFISAVKQLEHKFCLHNEQNNPSCEHFIVGAGSLPLQTIETKLMSQCIQTCLLIMTKYRYFCIVVQVITQV